MNDVKTFIASGILEMYVLGYTSPDETSEVERMAAIHDAVQNEIDAISDSLENYAWAHAIEPDPTIKTFLMATLDYMERMKNGEPPSFPPILHAGSKIADYAEWLNRDDMQLDVPLEDAHARIIGFTPQATTAIIWLKYGAPPEMHTNELEQFLIVEGTCEINIENDVHAMKPGDVLIIPLHKSHHVKVTSDYPCKIILQRVAA